MIFFSSERGSDRDVRRYSSACKGKGDKMSTFKNQGRRVHRSAAAVGAWAHINLAGDVVSGLRWPLWRTLDLCLDLGLDGIEGRLKYRGRAGRRGAQCTFLAGTKALAVAGGRQARNRPRARGATLRRPVAATSHTTLKNSVPPRGAH